MIDLSPAHTSELICPVDASMLAAWVESPEGQDAPWIVQPDRERKPQRLVDGLPYALILPVMTAVFTVLGDDAEPLEMALSCMLPGQSHGMHQDQQHHTGREWLTRVHVPVLTNPGAWFVFQDEAGWVSQFAMPAGHAYTFNALRRHDFGNEGNTPRVHLIFDVVKR